MVVMTSNLRATAMGAVGAVALILLLAPAQAQVTDEQVSAAIERGVKFFLDAQRDDGRWSEGDTSLPQFGHYYIGSNEVCAMLSLAYAGVSMNDPKMEKGFNTLLDLPMLHTYSRSLRILVIAKLLPHLRREQAEKARLVMKADAQFLVDTQHANGGWGYPEYDGENQALKDKKPLPTDPPPKWLGAKDTWWDFSNTQIAILGLSEAAYAGIEIPEPVFRKAQDLYLAEQFPDGGWDYGHEFGSTNTHRDNPYGSMTAAAVASLFLTRDILYPGLGCPCRNGASSGRVPKVDAAIDKGLEWLGKYFSAKEHPAVVPGGAERLSNWLLYWLYSCERAGLASGIKYFGEHDWYAQGAAQLVRRQRKEGSWGDYGDTAWAVCFLAKGRAPILFNKLQFDGLWNTHPRDLANLLRYVSHLKEQPFQWQIINFSAPVPDWHDAPILYISAESDLKLGDEDKKKLRAFADSGGTIFFEASCGNPSAKAAWERTLKEVWPEFELKVLTKEHPLWTADQKIAGRLPTLYGMDDGLRTFMFVTWQDMSCTWNRLQVTRDATLFQMGSNLYAYTTDRRMLRARLAATPVFVRESYVGTRLTCGSRRELKLAPVRHGGDWYVGKNYGLLTLAAASLAEDVGLKATALDASAPAELTKAGVHLAWLAGRKGVTLGNEDQAALKKFLADGGLLVAEAVMGDSRFDAEFRALAGQLGLKIMALNKDASILTGSLGEATGYAIDQVRFKYALRVERVGKMMSDLHGLYLGDRLVGIYSPFDISWCRTGMDAFDCRGYETEDAQAIWTNLLLWASAQPQSAAP
jgi:hypothetical protein